MYIHIHIHIHIYKYTYILLALEFFSKAQPIVGFAVFSEQSRLSALELFNE